MTTPRTNASQRIREALGPARLTQHEILSRTGMSHLAVKSTLNAMLKRKEIRRVMNENGCYLYSVCRAVNAEEGEE